MEVWGEEAEIAILLFAVILPVVVGPLVHLHYRRFGRFGGWQGAITIGALLYACGLLAFTLFPIPTTTDAFCDARSGFEYWQLRPGGSIGDVFDVASDEGWKAVPTSGPWLQVFFNIVLFVPLGMLLAYRWGKGVGTTLAVGFAVSLAVELTQGTGVWGIYDCPYRLADVDDLVTNTAGAGVGWLVVRLLRGVLPAVPDSPAPDTDPPTRRRRASAAAIDLLAILVAGILLELAVLWPVAAIEGQDVIDEAWFGLAAAILGTWAPALLVVLAIPLWRGDRATPGMWSTWLASQSPDGNAVSPRAVLVRFAVRWLPLLLASLVDAQALALVIVAVTETATTFVRDDQRSLSGALAGTTTVTRHSVISPA